MQITNVKTQRSITVRTDNVVFRPDGCLLVEAMFSGLVDLTGPAANVATRFHPTKAEAFEWIVTGQCRSVTLEDRPIAVIPDVEIHVNGPNGIVVRHFSEFLDQEKELRESGASGDVRSTLTLAGFDPVAEPVLREMHNGRLLLIFACIPPLVSENDAARFARFDLDMFGTEIEDAAGVPVIWDDKEVFVIPQTMDDTVKRIRHFLETYWEK